ncbi:MAG: 2-amino-4-hydroxy-6-hydroxymethyldihydropteridine diphosphokinase, partial [Candidatus Omnitrophica bacterium]|nr:2-amino-4-hydroxy-6-hydroxymethyldihydropteridine diphosphokinase [Candidatus Omnitrophota bacterium]
MSVVYIGIGSNLGDRQKNIDTAMEKLNSRKGVEIATVSSLVETESIGDANQPKFLNGVCKVETGLYPDELLDALKSIERELGRNRDSAGGKLSQEEQLKMFESGNLDAVRQATEISNKEKNDQEQK